MFKLINISGDDLRLDDKGVSQMVTHACLRAGVGIEGIALRGDNITLVCSDNAERHSLSYRFTALGNNVADEDIYSELRCRYDNDFRTVGVFQLADGYWTLTEKI